MALVHAVKQELSWRLYNPAVHTGSRKQSQGRATHWGQVGECCASFPPPSCCSHGPTHLLGEAEKGSVLCAWEEKEMLWGIHSKQCLCYSKQDIFKELGKKNPVWLNLGAQDEADSYAKIRLWRFYKPSQRLDLNPGLDYLL